MKKCPFCAEEIQDAAIVCKHCGRDVKSATRACPFCGKQIPAIAKVCPSCGDDVSGGSVGASTGAAAATTTQQAKQIPAALGCMVGLLLMIGACWWTLTPDTSPEAQLERAQEQRKRAEDKAKITVTVLCEDAVKQRLKAPGSAEFPFGNATNVEATGNNRYRLRSWVDSQNAFGAKLRSNFVCVMEGSGDSTEGYKLVEELFVIVPN